VRCTDDRIRPTYLEGALEIEVASASLRCSNEARRPVLGVSFVVLGIFWTGRESTSGLAAFWEHWWCPTPLAAIALGVSSVIALQRLGRAA